MWLLFAIFGCGAKKKEGECNKSKKSKKEKKDKSSRQVVLSEEKENTQAKDEKMIELIERALRKRPAANEPSPLGEDGKMNKPIQRKVDKLPSKPQKEGPVTQIILNDGIRPPRNDGENEVFVPLLEAIETYVKCTCGKYISKPQLVGNGWAMCSNKHCNTMFKVR